MRGDDGAGPAVAERLRLLGPLPAVTISEHWGEGSALMQEWEHAARVVVVDAARSGSAPGNIHRYDAVLRPIPAQNRFSSSHRFGVSEAVEMARVLECLPAQLHLIAIEGVDFALGRPLTPRVAGAVQEVAEELLQLMDAYRHSRYPACPSHCG